MRVTPLGFRLSVIVNENFLNFEKTVSRILSVLLLIFDLEKMVVLRYKDIEIYLKRIHIVV